MAVAATAVFVAALKANELENLSPLLGVPGAAIIRFFQPIQEAQHVSLPGQAGVTGDIRPAKECGDVDEAEVEVVDPVAVGDSTPGIIGMPVDPT